MILAATEHAVFDHSVRNVDLKKFKKIKKKRNVDLSPVRTIQMQK